MLAMLSLLRCARPLMPKQAVRCVARRPVKKRPTISMALCAAASHASLLISRTESRRPRPDAPYQTYLNRAGGRARVNPDPDWTLVTRVDRDPNAPWATSWDDFPPEILEAVASLQGGGGGFTPAGPKGGVFSRNNSTNTFPLRCCSSHAWGCIKKVKIVEEYLGSAIAVYDAVGWPHSHATEGAVCQLKRGLPPQVKSDILEVLKHDPRIKLGALRNYLVERKGVDPAHAKKIGTFLHNNRGG